MRSFLSYIYSFCLFRKAYRLNLILSSLAQRRKKEKDKDREKEFGDRLGDWWYLGCISLFVWLAMLLPKSLKIVLSTSAFCIFSLFPLAHAQQTLLKCQVICILSVLLTKDFLLVYQILFFFHFYLSVFLICALLPECRFPVVRPRLGSSYCWLFSLQGGQVCLLQAVFLSVLCSLQHSTSNRIFGWAAFASASSPHAALCQNTPALKFNKNRLCPRHCWEIFFFLPIEQ